MASTSCGIAGSASHTLVTGMDRYSANVPARSTPTPLVCAHRWRRPARQLRHRPHTRCPSPLTTAPGSKSCTFSPTAAMVPMNSWPVTMGTGMVRWAQASQL